MLASITRDVTARTQMEFELFKSKEELEQRVFERTEQLEKIMNELETEIEIRRNAEDKLIQAKDEITRAFYHEKELNELKSRFISTISHEYRTPLTVINTSTYLLENFYKKNNDEQFYLRVKIVQNAVKQMVMLLEDVLMFGRIEAGKLNVTYDNIDIIKLCKEQIDEIKITDKEHHFFVFSLKSNVLKSQDMSLLPDRLIIKSNEILLRRILSNLLSNAVKYSPDGERIELEIIDDFTDINIKIKDSGIGISDEEKRKIFEPFYRGTNTGTIAGTGLGLSIVKGCVESLDGEIYIDNHENKATVFKIIFPKIILDKDIIL